MNKYKIFDLDFFYLLADILRSDAVAALSRTINCVCGRKCNSNDLRSSKLMEQTKNFDSLYPKYYQGNSHVSIEKNGW